MREYAFIQEAAELILDYGDDSNLFRTLTVRELMWGYQDPLLKKVNELLKKFHLSTIDDHFGLFYGVWIFVNLNKFENFEDLKILKIYKIWNLKNLP